jgi:uncharacterized protein with GYD domain
MQNIQPLANLNLPHANIVHSRNVSAVAASVHLFFRYVPPDASDDCLTLTGGLETHSVSVLDEEEPSMPNYITLVRYTQQGMSKISASPSRLDAAKKVAETEKGKIQAWYLTMGHYDAVFLSEFPSDEACARFTLSVGSLGNISTETLKAFPEAEYRKIVGSL